MTDSTPIDNLLSQYEDGVETPSADLGWLNARSELEDQLGSLTAEQRKELAVLDRNLAGKARTVAAEFGDTLVANRAGRPSSHWWWYPDVLAPAAPSLGPKPPSERDRLVNAIINGVLVVALLGAGYFALSRYGIIPTPVAPSATPRPTSTPLPTATLDPVAFDFSSAKPTESPFKVITITVPDGWTAMPAGGENALGFAYGPQESPRAVFQIILEDTDAIYSSTLGLAQSVESPRAALEKFKADLPPTSGFVAGDVVDSSVGSTPGAALRLTAPANPQQGSTEATEFEVRAAHLDSGKAVLVIMQSDATLWEQVKPIFDQMVASVVLNPGNIPTPTPTPTLHPLQMTATAIQTQIIGLTPTRTPTASLTPTGGAATAEVTADAAVTAEVTADATATN